MTSESLERREGDDAGASASRSSVAIARTQVGVRSSMPKKPSAVRNTARKNWEGGTWVYVMMVVGQGLLVLKTEGELSRLDEHTIDVLAARKARDGIIIGSFFNWESRVSIFKMRVAFTFMSRR